MRSKYLFTGVVAFIVVAGSSFAISHIIREHALHVKQERQAAADRAEQKVQQDMEHQAAKAELERRVAAEVQEVQQKSAAFDRLSAIISKEAQVEVISGTRLRVNHFMAGMDFLQDVLNGVPKQDYVDLVSMYKTLEGYDGTTSLQALAICRSRYIGKYYILKGDVFHIQADRDYPLDGLNEFSLFGLVNLPPPIPVNVLATSDQKMPPYSVAPMLSEITDFQLGTNGVGRTIIIPVVKILVATQVRLSDHDPGEVIINDPVLVAQLLRENAEPPNMSRAPGDE